MRVPVKLKALAARAAPAAAALAPDVAGVGGGALVAFGAHQVYGPAGWIIAGVELLVAAILVGRARAIARAISLQAQPRDERR